MKNILKLSIQVNFLLYCIGRLQKNKQILLNYSYNIISFNSKSATSKNYSFSFESKTNQLK